MDKNLHDIDSFFLEMLEEYEAYPSNDIWRSIDNDLNRIDAVKYRTRYLLLLKTIISALFLLPSLMLCDTMLHRFSSGQLNNTAAVNIENKNPEDKNVTGEKTGNSNAAAVTHPINENSLQRTAINILKSAPTKPLTENSFLNYRFTNSNEHLILRNSNLSPSFKDLPALNSTVLNNALLSSTDAQEKKKDSTENKNDKAKIVLPKKHPLYLIPFLSFDHVTGRFQQQYKYGDDDETDVTNRERSDLSNTVGLLAEYGLSKKLSIQSGLTLSTAFASIGATEIKALQDNNGNYKFKLATSYGLAEITKTGIIPQTGDSILLNKASLTLQYISLPVQLSYSFKKGVIDINGTAGIALNKISKDRIEVNYNAANNTEIETIDKIEGLKKTFLSLNTGAEISYHLNNKISIGITTALRYSLTPVNQGTPVKTYPVSVGIGAMLRIKL